MIRKIKNFVFKIKCILQKIFRTHHTSDAELWNLDYHLAKILYKKIKAFKKMERHGFPSELRNEFEWEEILDNILFSLAFLIYDYDENTKIAKKLQNEYNFTNIFKLEKQALKDFNNKFTYGLNLLGKYLPAMWD